MDAFCAFLRLQKVSDQGDAVGKEVDELTSDVAEGSIESFQDARNEVNIGEKFFEEASDWRELPFLPESWVHDDVFEQIQELYLDDVLLIDYNLVQYLEKRFEAVVDDSLRQIGVVNIVDKRFDELDGACVDSGVADVEVHPHRL